MTNCTVILIALLALSPMVHAADDSRPIHYDSNSSFDEHIYTIETDSKNRINLGVRFSNIANDTNCENNSISSQDTASRIKPTSRKFSFSRKGSPNIALYEWHMCFIQDGITYKAWRGFDPGPNTFLEVSCFIPKKQLAAKETDKYLCKTQNISHADSNYSEFSQHCWLKDVCRTFETEDSYKLFLGRGVNNVALHKIVSPTAVPQFTHKPNRN